MKSPLNHCNSEMMHQGGWAKMRTLNSPNTTGNKQALKHNDKIMNKIGTFKMPNSPLNKNEFDIDYSGAKPVDLGNIPASNFTKAKKKLVEGYGGADNPDYQMEKGAYFYDKNKDKMRSSYLEYPEDAEGVEERYLGKNWDNSPKDESPLDCWEGYERVPGTKEFSKGSCRKKGSPAKQNMVTGENTDKIQTDERGEYSLVMNETQQGLKAGDTIRPSNNKKMFKPAVIGKSQGSKDGYLIGGDYDIEKTGDKNYILKNK